MDVVKLRPPGVDSEDEPLAPPHRRRLARLMRVLQWTVNLLLLLVAVLVLTPVGDRLGEQLTRIDPLAKADYIVVLGGDEERAAEAARLYLAGWAPKVIVSSTGPWADRLARRVAEFGVPPEAVLIDRAPRRTADHPASVAALPGVDKVSRRFLLVTSLYHTRRARACFARGGYQHVVMRAPAWRILDPADPRPFFAWAPRVRDLYPMAYEALACLSYKLRGWI